MSQVHETLAREWLAMCERKERVPLTVWETEQLLHGWLDRERLTRELGETNEALAACQSQAAGELRVLWLLKQNLAAWVAHWRRLRPCGRQSLTGTETQRWPRARNLNAS